MSKSFHNEIYLVQRALKSDSFSRTKHSINETPLEYLRLSRCDGVSRGRIMDHIIILYINIIDIIDPYRGSLNYNARHRFRYK